MNRVVSVKSLPNYLLELVFSDGLNKIIDIKPFIGEGLSATLGDEKYFQKVAIESGGGIYWPNGYDFCPNFLHDNVPAFTLIFA